MARTVSPGSDGQPAGGTRWAHVRLYHTVRTAHLERALELPPAPILYGVSRYDFDPDLAERVGAVRVPDRRAAALLARSPVRLLEVNEPGDIESVQRTATSLAWLRLTRAVHRRPRPLVVTYAIGNTPPFVVPPGLRRRSRLKRRVLHGLARYVWWEIDRIAYGTEAAAATYAAAFGGPRRPRASTVIPALPAPCACADLTAPRGDRVLFLGAFSPRKGLPLVLAAWPAIRSAHGRAHLVVLGKGALEDLARTAAEGDPSIELVVDPSREEIHRQLRAARVLVLPSQPGPAWREQVGLPIVEALAHGCAVVTTDETGLAQWLRQHGHVVVPGTAGSTELASAVGSALDSPRTPTDVVSDLPPVDGRLLADEWMRRGVL